MKDEEEIEAADPNEPSFSLNDFKRWMASQKRQTSESPKKSRLVGRYAESKIGAKRLINHITAENGVAEELARDFRRYGGVIAEVDRDNTLLIEVESGTFRVPKFFCRIDQD